MKRRVFPVAFVVLVLVLCPPRPARALDEPERLLLVGEQGFADGLVPLARRVLERFVTQYGSDPRLPGALLLLGKARLAQGEADSALEALRHAQTFSPVPGRPLEARFWEAEALFRLKRYPEARTVYDDVLRKDAASPLAPEALYGFAWAEIEMKQPEPAVTAFREFLDTWPEHVLAPSATFSLARILVDGKRFNEALPLLQSFPAKHGGHKLVPDAQYLAGLARIGAGDAKGGVADLRAFIAAYPNDPHAAAARAVIVEGLVAPGDREETEEAYKSLMARNTLESLSEAATLAGRLNRARDQEAAWRKLRAGFPEHPLARRAALELASRAFKRKEWKEASSLAAAAARSGEEAVQAEAWLLAGESELKLKHLAPAVKAFEAASAVEDADGGVRYRALAGLGLAREEQQEWRAALKAYEAVASKSPDATLRDWAKQRAAAVRPRVNGAPKTGERKPTKGKS
jgi:TolA-binding protein